ncbi:hypothetical protein VIGAN_06116600 [Vigna angularis var. angularis]|uniref:Uncharacterized protein n=1 Tax=Vigna angularis var. angularis TaxID=157739 RepID=A0A0S3SB31_PHAAN|nr:hypothetical protein VIGAN_06116600 [Vigna angularis var. angularis]
MACTHLILHPTIQHVKKEGAATERKKMWKAAHVQVVSQPMGINFLEVQQGLLGSTAAASWSRKEEWRPAKIGEALTHTAQGSPAHAALIYFGSRLHGEEVVQHGIHFLPFFRKAHGASSNEKMVQPPPRRERYFFHLNTWSWRMEEEYSARMRELERSCHRGGDDI